MQNDYKAILKQIESGLSDYYQSDLSIPTANMQRPIQMPSNVINTQQAVIPAFAKVVDVINDSPADKAVSYFYLKNSNINY